MILHRYVSVDVSDGDSMRKMEVRSENGNRSLKVVLESESISEFPTLNESTSMLTPKSSNVNKAIEMQHSVGDN